MDHGASQSTGAAAPTNPQPSVADQLNTLAADLLQSPQDDPDAWQQEQEEPQEGEQQEAPAPQEEPEAPAAEATEPEIELEEVEYAEGQKFKVPKELKRGWLREDDYTRKTQKLAEGFRQVDGVLQQLSQTQQVIQAIAPKLGQMAEIDGQIQQLRSLMTPQLRQTDPVEFGALGAQFNLLLSHRGELAQALQVEQQKVVHAMDQAHLQTTRARMESELPKLLEDVSDFNPDTHGKEAAEYLRKRGYAPEAAHFINTSPLAMADVLAAMKWRQLQADKKTAQKKVADKPAPTAKPGQRASPAEGGANLKKLHEMNRKSGGKDADIRRALIRETVFGRK